MSRKGIPNQKTIVKRDLAKEVLDSFTTADILKDLKSLKPDKRLLILFSLLEFVQHKLARQEIIDDKPKEIIIRRVEAKKYS